ncbi:probable G-protein coupled receptor 141 [Chiloscyllium punctatum]|uniref:probable G-protein coupled receptor 141 n=1 Tax=Chiloscyllium punctatum TaxID=137246 RepID=UPI003B639E45
MNNTTSLTSNDSSYCDPLGSTYNAALIAIYTLVLVGGSTGAIIMTWKIKSDSKSVTSTAVVNLILMHTFFLLTVPFRISYYILDVWMFGSIFCKLVSAMIHAHMYLCFMFYVAIVVIRMISFFQKKKTMDFYQPWHAVAVSLVLWVLVLVAVFPLFLTYFDSSEKDDKCFQFTVTSASSYVKVMNHLAVISVLTILGVLLAIQMGIMVRLMIRYQNTLRNQQEFGAQTKTLLFILIMICFVPYLGFRLFYVSQKQCSKTLNIMNEIFLALTSMSCFDVLAFLVASH